MRPSSRRPGRSRVGPRVLLLGAAVVSVGLIAVGVARHMQRMARSPEADAWRALGVAGAQLGAGPAACEAVPEGDARITCLQMAQARAVQLEDPAAVRRVCAAMVEGPWAQSCLLDALDVDPTLSLAAYTAACQSEVPLYVSHCLTHARDRFEGQPPGADPAIFATFYGAVLRRAAQPRERCEELRAEGRQACRDAWAR